MPIVRVEMWPGRTAEVKKKVAQEITQVLTNNIGCPEHAVTVVFDDREKQNWATGGKLHTELFKDKT